MLARFALIPWTEWRPSRLAPYMSMNSTDARLFKFAMRAEALRLITLVSGTIRGATRRIYKCLLCVCERRAFGSGAFQRVTTRKGQSHAEETSNPCHIHHLTGNRPHKATPEISTLNKHHALHLKYQMLLFRASVFSADEYPALRPFPETPSKSHATARNGQWRESKGLRHKIVTREIHRTDIENWATSREPHIA